MKYQVRVRSLCMAILLIIVYSCKKTEVPELTTTAITNITTTTAASGGSIISDGGAEIISSGVCFNTTGNPTTANQATSDDAVSGTYKSSLTQLIPDTYYTLRAYATNSAGTGYGDELSFVTLKITLGSVDDIDGNTYKTVTIGTQTWMAENLKTTKFNDNTSIPSVTDNTAWGSLTTPGYCWYNNDEPTYKNTYGALYNWYSVATWKLCPSGWHVPSDAEWTILSNYLGGEGVAGDKMKEAGSSHWLNFNSGSTNVSGFTALPGGGRISGSFEYIGQSGAWWSETSYNAGNAYCRELDDDIVELLIGNLSKSLGFSVRCLKNL